jgi:hypothetical protein
LIEQPAVHQQVEGIVWRTDLDRVKDVIPRLMDRRERLLRGIRATVPPHERTDLVHAFPLSQEEHETPCFPRCEGDDDVERGARVEAGAEAAGQRLTMERRRLRQGAVAAQE